MLEQVQYVAKGSSFSGSRSTSTRSTSTSTRSTSGSTSTKSTTTTTKPKSTTSTKSGTSKAKAGSTIKTKDGKTIKTSSKTPTNPKYKESVGVVGDNGYTPRYTNGYAPPAGTVVYRESNSALDYLPWVYLFSVMGDSPRNDQQVMVQPDGKEVQAKPVQEGIDGLLILNWIVLIIIVGAVIAGIVYLVNKLTTKRASLRHA
jgi:cobalamin biosynthesis Mg chelatase CobN